MRVVAASGASATAQPIRLFTSGQTVRVAGTAGQTHIRPNILRQPGPIVSAQSLGQTTATATLGGKQIIIQKPLNIVQNVNQSQIVTLVKTSQGVVLQKQGGSTATLSQVSNPQQNQTPTGHMVQQQNAITSSVVGNKTAVVAGNVVKLVSPQTVGGNKILMKNTNMVQVAKVGQDVTGKPTFVIANKQSPQLRGNQQIIVVTSGSNLRNVSQASIVSSSTNNLVSLVSTSTPQHATIVSSSVTPGQQAGTVKMIRGVQASGKPITFSVPMGLQGDLLNCYINFIQL